MADLAFTDACDHSQRLFASVMHRAAWEDLWSGGTSLQRLRLELGAMDGTGSWLAAVPRFPRYRIGGYAFAVSMSMYLCLPPGGVTPTGMCGCCGAKWGAYCSHFWSCPHKCTLIPHDVLRDLFYDLARSVYPTGRVKCPDHPGQQGMVSWRSFSPLHRPDGVVLYGAGMGHSILDVYCPSVVVPSASSWVSGGADYFMQQAEAHKRAQYGDLDPHHVMFPLVVSQFGALSPSLRAYIRVLHAAAGGRSDQPSWSARHFRQVAEQSVSVAYWRTLGEYFGDFISRGIDLGAAGVGY